MKTGICQWLESDRTPQDLYELVGRSRLDPHVDQLRCLVRAASRELFPYQNHTDPAVAKRAMNLQTELGRALDILSDTAKLEVYNGQILSFLRDDYARRHGDDPARWDRRELGRWLVELQRVHPEALRETIDSLAAEAGEGAEDRLAKAEAGRRRPVRVFAQRPATAAAAAVPEESGEQRAARLRNLMEQLAKGDAVLVPEDEQPGRRRPARGAGQAGAATSRRRAETGRPLTILGVPMTPATWAALVVVAAMVASVTVGLAQLALRTKGASVRPAPAEPTPSPPPTPSPSDSLASGPPPFDGSPGDRPQDSVGQSQTRPEDRLDRLLRALGFQDSLSEFQRRLDALQDPTSPRRRPSATNGPAEGATSRPPVPGLPSPPGQRRSGQRGARTSDHSSAKPDRAASETHEGAARPTDRRRDDIEAGKRTTVTIDSVKFSQAWELIHGLQGPRPDYRRALALLEAIIKETPKASDIDYAYAWATVCCAHLGEFDKALSYYTIVRTRFYGVITTNNKSRNWERCLQQARAAIARFDDPHARRVLDQMVRVDNSVRSSHEAGELPSSPPRRSSSVRLGTPAQAAASFLAALAAKDKTALAGMIASTVKGGQLAAIRSGKISPSELDSLAERYRSMAVLAVVRTTRVNCRAVVLAAPTGRGKHQMHLVEEDGNWKVFRLR